MAKAWSTEKFIECAHLVHGNTYLYDKTQYVNMSTKVIITCREHGDFEQYPQAHLRGNGCRLCGYKKRNLTVLEKYGVDNPMKNGDVCQKARQTCLDRYGYEWARSNKAVQQKAVETNRRLRGVDYPLQDSVVRDKMTCTIRDRYGVDNVGQIPGIRDKFHETCLRRYGCEEPLSSPVVRNKIKSTNMERYGGIAPMSSLDVQNKSVATCMNRYGVEHPVQNVDVVHKICETKAINGTYGTSSIEDILYDRLCVHFGENDVERQYYNDVYPFACDFYIESRDLYIELNAHWSHGYHWFDVSSEADVSVLNIWSGRDTAYYRNAVHVWSDADLKKRECAKRNRLNYIVFWDTVLRDVDLWFAMDCPDGQDWFCEYSWLPERDFRDVLFTGTLTGTSSNLSNIAKVYQYSVFYKREIDMWNLNLFRKGLPLQVWLYHNRYVYLNKTPDQLTSLEILRGFTISGILKGYTAFNCDMMDDVVKKYHIKSIYDPCAGWGERMLYCRYNHIVYHGVDVNFALKHGYDSMISDFHIVDQDVVFCDSSLYKPDFRVDAVVTCPPYGSLEIYSDFGSENLSEDDFLIWWDKVVKQSLFAFPKYFCFQVNQRWKDRLSSIVVQNGFDLVEDISPKVVRNSHFTRSSSKAGVKKEFESFLVFVNK